MGGAGTIATQISGGDSTLNNVTIASGTTVKVTSNTVLDLKGTIANGGTIALNSSGDATRLEISGSVSLNGSGHVTLTDNAHNSIVSDGLAATLTNFNMITGAGTIGDTHLTLINSGTIDATGINALLIDTGTNTSTAGGLVGSLTVTNNAGGILEASAGHTLQIDDNVLNNGLIEAGNIRWQSDCGGGCHWEYYWNGIDRDLQQRKVRDRRYGFHRPDRELRGFQRSWRTDPR